MAVETISEHACHGGVQGFYRHASRECGGAMRFSVFRPPQAARAPVPVLWFLAGLTCTEETFMVKAGAQRIAARLGLMLVAPDTSPRESRFAGDDADWDFGQGAGFYVDATEAPWSASYRMHAWVTEELPEVVAARVPADPARQGILGHSMGGHGALVCAFRHPERYRTLSALAPIVAPTQVPWGRKAFAGYLGPDESAWRAWDACALAKTTAWSGPVLVDQGESDKFLATQLQPERLVAACEGTDIRVQLRRHPGHDHSYWFIQTVIADHLRHHARGLGLARD